ncbi:MAG TPA: ATP-binding protein [Vicinamibacterales bacterium]|nr:ATP-binding protein [Vicinamibacterales bacterium]
MTILSSLRSRIFLGSALLAVLSIGVALYVVNAAVADQAERTLERELTATASMVDNLRTGRGETYTQMARFIADAPRLKAAVDTNDPPTVADVANEYQSQIKSNLLVVTSKRGDPLATIGAANREAIIAASQPAVRSALGGKESSMLVPQPDGIMQFVTVPLYVGVQRPDILGTVSVGFLLDNALADQLKQQTAGSDIAFGMDGQIFASTLPRADYVALAGRMRTSGISQVVVGGEEYAVLSRPLSTETAAGPGPVALIMRSRTEQLRLLQPIRTGLIVTAVVAIILAIVVSFTIARTITRPIASITGVMREVAATGDLTRKIALSNLRNDEDAQLLATTFNTLTDSVARFQREMSQKERLTSLGRLSTVIAHEIRNPLMIIKASLHGLRQPDVDSAALREAIADIDEEVARLNRIVNEVLDFARPIRFDLAPVDLNALCRESAAAAKASGPGPEVRLELDETLRPLTSDSERLRLALVNLLVNARHAMDGARGVEPSDTGSYVTLATRVNGTHAQISVVDQGVGIAPEDVTHVFDPYFTTKRGGTGLGLPIVKNIVEGLGGTIGVTSTAGRGTEIRIDLPT